MKNSLSNQFSLEETKRGTAEMLFADVLLEVEQAACTKEMMTMELE